MTEQPTAGEPGNSQGWLAAGSARSGPGTYATPGDWVSGAAHPACDAYSNGPEGSAESYPVGPPAHWATTPPQPFIQRQSAPPSYSPQFAPQPLYRQLSAPPPGRPPGTKGGLVALMTVVPVVIGSLFIALVLPSLAGIRPGIASEVFPTSTPGSSSSPAGGSQSSPVTTMPSDPTTILKKNPLYALKVPAKCPTQRIPRTAKAFRAQVKALVACENKAWRAALADTPIEFVKPKVKFYRTSTSSRCGRLGTAFPAAYCTGDRTLYFSSSSYAQGRYYRLAVAQFVMHEYAHHVQGLAEIFTASGALQESTSATSRRIELQAHCIAHYKLTHSGLGFSASDRSDAEFQFNYTTDPKGHGSAKAERYWGRRGLAATKLSACNTWSAKASRVK